MKCLVFSDSHGSCENIRSVLELHRSAEVVFFLGDGLRDVEQLVEEYRDRAWFFARGNCDFKGDILGERVAKLGDICLSGKRIVFTHGDLYGVKLSNEGIDALTENTGADIVLYGHTHRAREDFRTVGGRGVYFFNPGTVSGVDSRPTYGILDIDENNVLFSIALVAIC